MCSAWKNLVQIPNKFTPKFTAKIQWYPGHMDTGIKKMQAKLKSVDCIVEVHDARIPFSGRNRRFKHLLTAAKPHVLLLNKMDLTDRRMMEDVKQTIMSEESVSEVIYTNCKNQKCIGLKKVVPTVIDMIQASDRYHRNEVKEYCLMVIGVPNVGKSSFINILRSTHLRRGKAAHVGAIAGITRSVQEKIKISEDPPIYLLDTPGILDPSIKNYEAGMKLALCASFPDHLIGEEAMSDYLLYYLNKHENYRYVEHLGLEEPSVNILEVLVKCCLKNNMTIKRRDPRGEVARRPNLVAAASLFIRGFREGMYGPMLLDSEIVQKS